MNKPGPDGWFSPCGTSSCLQARRDGDVVLLRATEISSTLTLQVTLAEFRSFVADASAGSWADFLQ